MAAYVISDVKPRDAAAFETYRVRASASIQKYGGKYLVRGGAVQTLEGDWRPRSIVIVEFADIEAAHRWYRSPEYADALATRNEALERNLILVDGVSGAN